MCWMGRARKFSCARHLHSTDVQADTAKLTGCGRAVFLVLFKVLGFEQLLEPAVNIQSATQAQAARKKVLFKLPINSHSSLLYSLEPQKQFAHLPRVSVSLCGWVRFIRRGFLTLRQALEMSPAGAQPLGGARGGCMDHGHTESAR